MSGDKMGGGAGAQHGSKGAGKGPVETFDETDLASDIAGKDDLQRNGPVHTRHTQADVKGDTDSLMESFEKLDKNVRAKRDLGKHDDH